MESTSSERRREDTWGTEVDDGEADGVAAPVLGVGRVEADMAVRHWQQGRTEQSVGVVIVEMAAPGSDLPVGYRAVAVLVRQVRV